MRAELETNEKIRNFFQGSFILQKEPGKNMCTKVQNPLQPPLNPAASPGSLASPSWCWARWWVHQTSSTEGPGMSQHLWGLFLQILATLFLGKSARHQPHLGLQSPSSAPRDSHPALCFCWHRHRGQHGELLFGRRLRILRKRHVSADASTIVQL